MNHRCRFLSAVALASAALFVPSSVPAAPTPIKSVRPTLDPGAPLDNAAILKRLVDGVPGDWKFMSGTSGVLTSGAKVKMGSDYSGQCLTYKSQDRGINLGHVSDCSKTKDGNNVVFRRSGGADGSVIRYGDLVSFSVSGADKPLVCYGKRDHGIDLNWGTDDAGCKDLDGSEGKGAAQWKLVPATGSSRKLGDSVSLADRFALHNVVAGDSGDTMVKCARVTGLLSWVAGDLKWRSTCEHFELVITHRELLESLGKDPMKLAVDACKAAGIGSLCNYIDDVL
jgi:hypothetical protein